MTNKQKGFSIIELLIVFGFMGLIMMLMILAMEHVQNNSSIVDEKNFLDNFFNNINNDDLSNQTLFKEANNTTKMNLKTSNQPLSKDTLNSLYQIGLFTQSHTVNENGSLNSSLGPMIIYPYGLNDKMNGKLTVLSTNNSNKKEAVSTRFYTVSYPLVEEDKCAAFLNFIQKSSSYQKYTLLINNIQMSSTNNIGSISGNEDYFHQVCHTDKEHQYNVVQISNE